MLRKALEIFLGKAFKSNPQPEENPVLSVAKLRKKILEFLPMKDLKNCRLVNITWKLTATPLLLKRSCVSFTLMNNPRVNQSRRVISPEEKLLRKKYLKRGISSYLSQNPIPSVQNLKIKIEPHYEDKSVIKLFKHYSKTLAELDYTFPAFITTEVSSLKIILPRLKNLKKLKLTLNLATNSAFPEVFSATETSVIELTLTLGTDYFGDSSVVGSEEIDFNQLCDSLKNFNQNFPNLQSLTLGRTPFKTLANQFVQALLQLNDNQSSLKNLRKLEVHNEIFRDFEKFASHKFTVPLTSLSVSFEARQPWSTLVQAAKAYENLLSNHAATLTKLQLRTSSIFAGSPRSVVVTLPIMPKLRKLQILHKDYDVQENFGKCNFNFKFQSQNSTSDKVKIGGNVVLDYSVQFPELIQLSFKVIFCDLEASKKWRDPYSKMRPALDIFVPQDQVPPIKCPTLQSLNLIGVGKKDLMEFASANEKSFPNVHNRIFNAIRK